MAAKLSVNVNKYALLRNSRGQGVPDLVTSAQACIAAGAHGITVHPRLDQRHIRFDDVPTLHHWLAENHPSIEFNVECEDHPMLLEMVEELCPAQCTLVPVTPGEVTSDHGWDVPRQAARLQRAIAPLKARGIRVSLFANPIPALMKAFADTGADRVEFYTGPYAHAFGTEAFASERAVLAASIAAARELGLEINAGHDLDRFNLLPIADEPIDEVSIGHAMVSRALEVGTTAAVKELLVALGHEVETAPVR